MCRSVHRRRQTATPDMPPRQAKGELVRSSLLPGYDDDDVHIAPVVVGALSCCTPGGAGSAHKLASCTTHTARTHVIGFLCCPTPPGGATSVGDAAWRDHTSTRDDTVEGGEGVGAWRPTGTEHTLMPQGHGHTVLHTVRAWRPGPRANARRVTALRHSPSRTKVECVWVSTM